MMADVLLKNPKDKWLVGLNASKNMIIRSNIGLESNTAMRTVCLEGLGEIMVTPLLFSTYRTTDSNSHQQTAQCSEDLWSPKNVAQAQAQDPDIGPVVDQVSREWKKPTAEEFQPLSRVIIIIIIIIIIMKFI